MAEALRLAERGLYSADPNPRVGCLLVNAGKIVGRGYHLVTGQGHAEANALLDAGAAANGATAYVTLEPCSFEGRTPSCATALIEAGVTRVVTAMTDPHERNAGRGFQILKDAGVKLTFPFMEASAAALNPGHIKRHQSGIPYVRLKMAMSMDGKTALANGQSQWITGPEARQDVQRLRARSSAIVTGVQTVIDDNPRLNVRPGIEFSPEALGRIRPVYILDPRLRTPADAQLVNDENNVVVCAAGTLEPRKFAAQTLEMGLDVTGRIDLQALLVYLGARECNELLFECGATLAGSLLKCGLCDELVIYMAPKFMGSGARSLLNVPEIDNMSDLFNMAIVDMRFVGSDIRITARPKPDQER